MPHTATAWLKCFCKYRLKCPLAISGMGLGWDGNLWTHVCMSIALLVELVRNLVCIGFDLRPTSTVPRWWWIWTWGVRYLNVSRGIVVSVILMQADNWKRGLHVAAWAFQARNRCNVSGSRFHYPGYHLHPRNTTRIHRSLSKRDFSLRWIFLKEGWVTWGVSTQHLSLYHTDASQFWDRLPIGTFWVIGS